MKIGVKKVGFNILISISPLLFRDKYFEIIELRFKVVLVGAGHVY